MLVLIIGLEIFISWFVFGGNQLAKAYQSTIAIPENLCDLPSNATAKYFSVTIKTSQVGKIREDIINLTNKYNASVTLSQATSGLSGPTLYAPESYSHGYGNIYIYVPLEKAESFIKDVHKIASAPNQISNEYIQTDPATVSNKFCSSSLEYLKDLQSKENIYLSELFMPDSGQDVKSLVDELTRIRSDARIQLENIKDLKENKLNKLGVNLILEEVPEG